MTSGTHVVTTNRIRLIFDIEHLKDNIGLKVDGGGCSGEGLQRTSRQRHRELVEFALLHVGRVLPILVCPRAEAGEEERVACRTTAHRASGSTAMSIVGRKGFKIDGGHRWCNPREG